MSCFILTVMVFYSNLKLKHLRKPVTQLLVIMIKYDVLCIAVYAGLFKTGSTVCADIGITTNPVI